LVKRNTDLTVAQSAQGILAEPADLLRYVDAKDLEDDDGLTARTRRPKPPRNSPRTSRTSRPRRTAGYVAQGPRGGPRPPVADLAEILKGVVRCARR
jgi:hypothetical protein